MQQQQQCQQDSRSHGGTGSVGATHPLIRAPKVSALPSTALIAVADAPSLDVDSHGAGKTISRAAYGAGARGNITGPRRNTQAPRFLKATPFEQGNTKRVETKRQSNERIRREEKGEGGVEEV